jgi:hypothetical protein
VEAEVDEEDEEEDDDEDFGAGAVIRLSLAHSSNAFLQRASLPNLAQRGMKTTCCELRPAASVETESRKSGQKI